MRTVLVVAHRTLVGDALLDEVSDLVAAGPCRFRLLVPVVHPSDHPWTEGEVRAAAGRRLEEGLARFRELGAEVTGEVGDANVVDAVLTSLRSNPADEILLSTLPPRVSQWLRWDVVNRLRRTVAVPVTHVVYGTERVRA